MLKLKEIIIYRVIFSFLAKEFLTVNIQLSIQSLAQSCVPPTVIDLLKGISLQAYKLMVWVFVPVVIIANVFLASFTAC